jgi:hypothetical protein
MIGSHDHWIIFENGYRYIKSTLYIWVHCIILVGVFCLSALAQNTQGTFRLMNASEILRQADFVQNTRRGI